MATQKYNTKMNLDLSGDSFTDETHSDVGAAAFTLDHDWFINDTASGDVLVIRDAAAGGGNLLVENTDYTISNQDTTLSDSDHVDKDVYSDITIINAAYQAGALYFSGKYVADSVDHTDVSQITTQYTAISASASITPTSYTCYGCTAGTNGIIITLPAATEYNKNLILDFIKLDDTDSCVMVDGNGAETINGLASIFLIEQYQKITIISTGSAWIITQGTLIADTGYINRSDWTNVHLGTSNLVYDGKGASPFTVGEIIKEATSNNTGIVLSDSGGAGAAGTLVLWRVTGDGIWTNNRVITGQTSAVTADVDNAATDKNTDYDFYHGFTTGTRNLFVELIISTATSGTDATSFIYGKSGRNGGDPGYCIYQVDTDNFKFQMSSNGGVFFNDAGAVTHLDTEDYSYRIITKLII